jgi:translation initiation factor IF-2
LEVIDIARKYHIPLVVALNKIDRVEADVDKVLSQLVDAGVNPEQLGGDVPCIPISAKRK